MTQLTLFDQIAKRNTLITAGDFAGNDFVVMRVERHSSNNERLARLIDRLTNSAPGQPAWPIACLPPLVFSGPGQPVLPVSVAVALVEPGPPCTDIDQLTLIDADLYELIAGAPFVSPVDEAERAGGPLGFRCFRYAASPDVAVPAVAFYERGELQGIVAGLYVPVDGRAEVLEALRKAVEQ